MGGVGGAAEQSEKDDALEYTRCLWTAGRLVPAGGLMGSKGECEADSEYPRCLPIGRTGAPEIGGESIPL